MTVTSKQKRLLLVRLDRIGDLVLTLPVDEAVPEFQTSWWIPKGLKFIASHSQPPRVATEVDRKISIKKFFHYLKLLRRENYDTAIVFHGPWWVSFLFWLARIPHRSGVKSQWHSYLFLNRGIRQKRSRAEMSELEYNFRLLESVLDYAPESLKRKTLKLGGDEAEKAALLKTYDLKHKSFFIVHPGMGGSALNWPSEHYTRLIIELSKKATVVVTGTASDDVFLKPIRTALHSEAAGSYPIVWLDQKLNGHELIHLLGSAKAIVAPSTGVLHLAASTGRPTVGIFSPVRVQQPRRWGPQGEKVKALMPEIESCPGEMRCLGASCSHYDCMAFLAPNDVLKAIEELESSL